MTFCVDSFLHYSLGGLDHLRIRYYHNADESVHHLVLETNIENLRLSFIHTQLATKNHVTIIIIIKPTDRPCLKGPLAWATQN